MNTKEELIQRWDGFLKKIEDRFHESLKHAEEACSEQLVATDYEYETVIRSWQGMKAQIHELIRKIYDTWHAKVEPEMRQLGTFWSEESYKASEANDRLNDELFAFQRHLEGKLSQQFYDHAIQIANKKASCSQCAADIEIRNDIFRSQYITCSYCNAVNTIEPETKFLKIGWGVVDNIAAVKAQQEYDVMNNAVEAIRSYRGQAPCDYCVTYEKAYFTYWDTFFKERMKLDSEAIGRYEKDMERKRVEFEEYKKIQIK